MLDLDMPLVIHSDVNYLELFSYLRFRLQRKNCLSNPTVGLTNMIDVIGMAKQMKLHVW
jgi:hypothetical protein